MYFGNPKFTLENLQQLPRSSTTPILSSDAHRGSSVLWNRSKYRQYKTITNLSQYFTLPFHEVHKHSRCLVNQTHNWIFIMSISISDAASRCLLLETSIGDNLTSGQQLDRIENISNTKIEEPNTSASTSQTSTSASTSQSKKIDIEENPIFIPYSIDKPINLGEQDAILKEINEKLLKLNINNINEDDIEDDITNLENQFNDKFGFTGHFKGGWIVYLTESRKMD
ncbi:hypothetical protein Tco_1152525 [Tanacetum coccineum]